MATKYVLHGGLSAHKNEDNNLFFKEVLVDAPQNANILLVYFAKDIDRIPINREEDIFQFEHNKGTKLLRFITANESNFIDQLKSADIVFLHGGNSDKITTALCKYPNLETYFSCKTVAADSAGVNALSFEYYSNIYNTKSKGLGLVPFTVICHYHEGDEKNLDKTYTISNLLLLKEYKYFLFSK